MTRYAIPLLIGAMALILASAAVWLARPAEPSYPPLVSRSTDPDGARALALWVSALGYQAGELDTLPYAVDPQARVLFVLGPLLPPIGEREAVTLLDWVDAGGTLVLAFDDLVPTALLQHLDLEAEHDPARAREARPAQPLAGLRPVATSSTLVLRDSRGEWAPLLVAGDAVVAAERAHGRGRVIVVADGALFSNAGLRQPGAADVLLHVLRGVPPGSVVLFDEVHHGLGRDLDEGVLALLARTSPGRALLYVAALGFAALALGGRRFGRPLAPPPRAGRSAGEYVSAMATLFRRAGKRRFVAQHFERELRRAAARALALDAGAGEEALAAQARERGHDAGALREVLARLRGGAVSEAELVRLVRRGEQEVAGFRAPGARVRMDAAGASGRAGDR